MKFIEPIFMVLKSYKNKIIFIFKAQQKPKKK